MFCPVKEFFSLVSEAEVGCTEGETVSWLSLVEVGSTDGPPAAKSCEEGRVGKERFSPDILIQ